MVLIHVPTVLLVYLPCCISILLENKTTDHPFTKNDIHMCGKCMPIPVAHSFKKYKKIHQTLFSFSEYGNETNYSHTYIHVHVHGGNIPYAK